MSFRTLPPSMSCYDKALGMLARREHTRAELHGKLKMLAYPLPDIETALDRLAASGLQSDERAALSMVRISASKSHGPRRLKAAAQMKGLADDQLNQALQASNIDWVGLGQDLVSRKFGTGPYDAFQRQKIIGLLIRRGFSYDIATKLAQQKDID